MILHADEQLRSYLSIACSQFKPIPLLGIDPWKTAFKGTTVNFIFDELFYAYEKHNSILQFKYCPDLVTRESRKVRGCS